MGAPGPAYFMGVFQPLSQYPTFGLARPDCSHDAVLGASEHPPFVLVQRVLQCHAEAGCEGVLVHAAGLRDAGNRVCTASPAGLLLAPGLSHPLAGLVDEHADGAFAPQAKLLPQPVCAGKRRQSGSAHSTRCRELRREFLVPFDGAFGFRRVTVFVQHHSLGPFRVLGIVRLANSAGDDIHRVPVRDCLDGIRGTNRPPLDPLEFLERAIQREFSLRADSAERIR